MKTSAGFADIPRFEDVAPDDDPVATHRKRQADLAFGGHKAAPFVKGGGRKQAHPNDAHGRKRAKARALASKMRSGGNLTSMSVSDLANDAKWHHGWIPENAAALASKEHKKFVGPSNAEKIRNAATMYGTGSAQHKAAIKRFGGAPKVKAKAAYLGHSRMGVKQPRRGGRVHGVYNPAVMTQAELRAGTKKPAHALSTRRSSFANTDLAVTPGGRIGDASPLGKPGSKRKLSDYEREVAHALMRKRGIPKERAIPMARGIINNWAHGHGGKVSGAVRAGSLASIAQRKSFTSEQGTVIELAVLHKAQRDALPSSAFVFPKARAFPIHDRPHAKAALRLAGRKGPAVQAKVRAAVAKRYPGMVASLSNDVDLVMLGGESMVMHEAEAKWHHGFIPANAEAELEKEHKAKGHGVRSGAHSLASAKKFHSGSTKAKMTQKDLRDHANQHVAAAKRARTPESTNKHLKEAQSSMDEINRRKTENAVKRATAAKVANRQKHPSDDVVKAKRSSRAVENLKRVNAKAEPEPSEDLPTGPQKVTKIMSMDPVAISKEMKTLGKIKDPTPAQKRRLTVLNKEKARRIAVVSHAQRQAREASKLIAAGWPSGKEPLEVHSRFIAKLVARFPALKKHLSKLRKPDGTVRGVDTLRTVLDEAVREISRRIAGPLIASGALTLGLHFIAAKGGG
jgi:hypothetical protein